VAWGSVDEAIAQQRPLPSDLLRIIATGEKSDRAPVDERWRWLHHLSPISNRRRTLLDAGAISGSRHQRKSGLLTPLVADESEDGDQSKFTTAHANHYAARFVAYLGDEISDFRFLRS
jgi:hypothetical protein